MADAPATPQWFLPGRTIAQTPFMQSWQGKPPPFANTMDQIQQSLTQSGVYPGQMPDNTFLGNTAARYAFERTLPGASPYAGAMTIYMQGKGMPTGIPLGLLGLQGGIGQPPPPNSSGPPYPGGSSPGNYPPPGGGGPPNLPPPGGPAPPPFPGGAGGPGAQPPGGSPPPPQGGGLLGGSFSNGYQSPGLISGQANDSVAPPPRGGNVRQGGLPPVSSGTGRFAQLQQQGMQALQGVTDPAQRYMMAMAYHIAPASIGMTNEQINQFEQGTMGSTYNKATGQVQRNY